MRLLDIGNLSWNKYATFDNSLGEQTLHLFRALLRQATYLPDSAARQYFRRHIVSRFRAYHPQTILQSQYNGARSLAVIERRRSDLLRTARKGVIFLQRANDGHPRHLSKILAMTYGRVGKRRHTLIKPLKVPDIPADQGFVEKLSDPRFQGVPQPSRQLSALVRAQARRKLGSTGPSLEPQIPETNSWGRPMPVKRVRNMKRKWYGETLRRIMPPLPETEWNRLRKLASGETKWEGPIRLRGNHEVKKAENEIVRGTLVGGSRFSSSPHRLTARYMRRLWTKLFAQCPLMQPNELRKQGWDVQWGDIQVEKSISLSSSSGPSIAMFAGVDHQGKRIQIG